MYGVGLSCSSLWQCSSLQGFEDTSLPVPVFPETEHTVGLLTILAMSALQDRHSDDLRMKPSVTRVPLIPSMKYRLEAVDGCISAVPPTPP